MKSLATIAWTVLLVLIAVFATGPVGANHSAADIEPWAAELRAVPEAMQGERRPMMRVQDVSRGQAEALMSLATAALWVESAGEIVMLGGDGALPSVNQSPRKAEVEDTATVAELLAEAESRYPGLREGAWGHYLLKTPAFQQRPELLAGSPLKTTTVNKTQAIVLSEDFEGDPFNGRWQRYDTSDGQYMWTTSDCEAHAGQRSADAVRGGSEGASLGCQSSYPSGLDSWLYDSQCEDLRGASQAWLELFLSMDVVSGSERFLVYFVGPDEFLYGWSYTGSFPSWWQLTFNLRQWTFLGDLSAQACNQLYFVFSSDATNAEGFGARIDDVTIRSDQAARFSCAAAAQPASGPAPLTVNLSATVAGASGAVDYFWFFGDGTSSEEQSPTHTYDEPDSYNASLIAGDSQGWSTCTAIVEVTEASECSLSCAAQVPTSAVADAALRFTGSATATDCSGGPVYSWDFGDGTTAATAVVDHAYTTAGTFTWSLTVTADSATCTRGGTITVSAAPSTQRYMVATVAHAVGFGDSRWRSDVAVVNHTADDATLALTHLGPSGQVERSERVAAGTTVEWQDVLVGVFGYPDDASVSGAMHISSDVPIAITSRTYNESETGTYGQYLPAVVIEDSLVPGQVALLPQVKSDTAFYTNIGVLNTGNRRASVDIVLRDDAGDAVGETVTLDLWAGSWVQANDVFRSAGAGSHSTAYATLEITSGDSIWGYASVVDRQTKDPTTIPMMTAEASPVKSARLAALWSAVSPRESLQRGPGVAPVKEAASRTADEISGDTRGEQAAAARPPTWSEPPRDDLSQRPRFRVPGPSTTAFRAGPRPSELRLLALGATVDLGAQLGSLEDRTPVKAADRGHPWIVLDDGVELPPVFAEADAVAVPGLVDLLERPLGMAAADFDEDGVPDLVSTFGAEGRGVATLHGGNVDAIYPHSAEAQERRARGTFTGSPLLTPARVFPLSLRPDLVGAGDFDADDHQDLVLAERGGEVLLLLSGDGYGGFAPARQIALPGAVTAMAVGEMNRRDGLADVVVGVADDEGAHLLVFEGPDGALAGRAEAVDLPGPARAIVLGRLDRDVLRDAVALCDDHLFVVRGRDRRLSVASLPVVEAPDVVITSVELGLEAEAMALGNFLGGRERELAVLDEAGTVHILDAAELIAGRLVEKGRREVGVAAEGGTPSLLATRISSLPKDDLVVVEGSGRRLHLVATAGRELEDDSGKTVRRIPAPEPTVLDAADEAFAVLPMRLNTDALADLVVLKGGSSPWAVLATKAKGSFLVDSPGDEPDADWHDSACLTEGGTCTLRAAIEQANFDEGASSITFAVGSIRPGSGLPAPWQPITIDGTSAGVVELDGSSAGQTSGMSAHGGDSVVRGMAFHSYTSHGLVLRGTDSGNNLVEGCFFGTDRTGTEARPNNNNGINLNDDGGNGTVVGGAAQAARNVILGSSDMTLSAFYARSSEGGKVLGNLIGTGKNGDLLVSTGGHGVELEHCADFEIGSPAQGAGNLVSGNRHSGVAVDVGSGHLIQGNLIGTDLGGENALGNEIYGVFVGDATTVTVGGSTLGARNVVSGNSEGIVIRDSDGCVVRNNFVGTDVEGDRAITNQYKGILVTRGSTDTTVQGNLVSGNGTGGISVSSTGTADNVVFENLVGIDADGEPLPNSGAGVTVYSATETYIGHNIIAFNDADGVDVVTSSSTGNKITENSIFENEALGIDLAGRSVTANDPGDGDEGANRLQNFPVLSLSPDGTIVAGTLDSMPGPLYTIELFANDECDPSGHGEGQRFLTSIPSVSGNNGSFSHSLTSAWTNITATATDPDGNTSEFSACATLPTGVVTSISPDVAPNYTSAPGYFAEPLRVRIVGEKFKRHANTTVRLVGEPGDAEPTVTVLGFDACNPDEICAEISAEVRGFDGLREGDYDVLVTNNDASRVQGADLFHVSSLYVPPVEVNQAVPMECSAAVPCIADHGTAIRVQVLCNGAGCEQGKPAVTGVLYVNRSTGQPIHGSPFAPNLSDVRAPESDTVRVVPRGQASQGFSPGERYNSRDQLNFLFIGEGELGVGDYTFRFVLNPRHPDVTPTQVPEDRLLARTSTAVLRSSAERLRLAVYLDNDSWTERAELLRIVPQIDGWMRQLPAVFPLSRDRFFFEYKGSSDTDIGVTGYVYDSTFTAAAEATARLNQLLPRDGAFTHSVLFTNRLAYEGLTPCGAPGGAWICTHSVVLLDVTTDRLVAPSLPHEMGHQLELGDTYVGTNSPWSRNPITEACRNHGSACPVEVGHFSAYQATAAVEDGRFGPKSDFMGRGSPESKTWIDLRTWDDLYERLMLGNGKTLQAAEGSWVLVSGEVGADGTAAMHPPAFLEGTAMVSTPPPGDLSVVLRDSAGQSLSDLSFPLLTTWADAPFVPERVGFSWIMTAPQGLREIALLRDGVQVATRRASASVPTVTVLTPNGGETLSGTTTVRWSASDPDGDPLSSTVLYAPDGALFEPIASDLEGTSYVWDTVLAKSGSRGRIRVIVSDGFYETSDDSDGDLSIGPTPPLVAIAVPIDGAVLPAGTPVLLQGSAYDLDDGSVPDDSLTFTSSRDGALGVGSSVVVPALTSGIHEITLSAVDSDGLVGTATATVEVGEVEDLSVAITAEPASGQPPLEVEFAETVTGGVVPFGHSWSFGDGHVSVEESPIHIFTEPGSYDVRLLVQDGQGTSAAAGTTITVAVGDINHLYVIPTVAHALGFGTSRWRSDVAVVNDSGASAALTVTFLGGSAPEVRGYALAAGATVEWTDILVSLFGLADDASSSGALHLGSDIPVAITSRTYNQSEDGTYGQFLPAVLSVDALATGEVGLLPQIKSDTGFYTNIGVVNTGDEQCTVRVRLYGASGGQTGNDTWVVVEPGRWSQANDIFASAGAGAHSTSFATVEVLTPGASAWAYASVVDRQTKDPTTIPVLRTGE